ncbi:MAG: RsmD family RNA methyltransferase, partial [Planctomycetales bacterium]
MKRRSKKSPAKRQQRRAESSEKPSEITIIGGKLGGRKLKFSGWDGTRPMKHRVREAAFNLVGPSVKKTHAIDLFAGTGALGLEALSRGAARATFIERHFPSVRIIRENAAELGLADSVEVVPGDVFFWRRTQPELGQDPWLAFCSPPYDFYLDREGDMLELIGELISAAPENSVFVVEFDSRWDPAAL